MRFGKTVRITMADGDTEPIFYGNVFRHGVDGKRRVQIPAKWRPRSGQAKLYVMLRDHPVAGTHLRILPVTEMIRLRGELNKKMENDPAVTELKRILARGLDDVELDSAGRICLKQEMAAAAGIGINQQVVLSGVLDYFEIWNSDRFDKSETATAHLRPVVNQMVG